MKKILEYLFIWVVILASIFSNPTIGYCSEPDNSEIQIQSDCNSSFENIYSDSNSAGGITLKVTWNEPVLGEPTTFHVSADGGSGLYKFNMEAPSYSNPNENSYESVADPTRGEWIKYTAECSSYDYSFTMTASGTYNFRFHVMDLKSGVTYLRTNTYIKVADKNYPSINDIISATVKKCNSETDGTDFGKALWLHDWLIEQLEYDSSLKWSSAESALTRGLGTCQAYESAYSRLLSAAGIQNAETRDTDDGHTWNAMKIDGQWYQVDCTWDDTKDNYYSFDSTHLYFGLTDELMAIAHKGHNNIYTEGGYSTRSTSLDDNYYVKTGEAREWALTYRERIQENLDFGKTEFVISSDNSSYPPSISGIQNGIIGYVLKQMEWKVNGQQVIINVDADSTKFNFTVKYSNCEHKWDSGEIIKKPSCTDSGIKKYTCTICGQSEEQIMPALGHEFSDEWVIDKAATFTDEGSKSHHCIRCSEKSDITIIEKLNKYTESISYRTHIQNIGWQERKKDGAISGTTGISRRVEAFDVRIDNQSISGDVKYRAFVQNSGWQEWGKNGSISGTTGLSLSLEAIEIMLTDELNNIYDIYYRTHIQDYGWLGWSKNGNPSGSRAMNKRIEAIEVRLVKKGEAAPGSVEKSYLINDNDSICYRSHVQDMGWTNYAKDGGQCGTTGYGKRLEAVELKLSSTIEGSVQYRTHIQDYGWQDWKKDGQLSGTSNYNKRIEAIQIKLTGQIADKYDIYYRAHIQNIGWQSWVKNGEVSGTEGQSRRIEAIEIKLVTKI